MTDWTKDTCDRCGHREAPYDHEKQMYLCDECRQLTESSVPRGNNARDGSLSYAYR